MSGASWASTSAWEPRQSWPETSPNVSRAPAATLGVLVTGSVPLTPVAFSSHQQQCTSRAAAQEMNCGSQIPHERVLTSLQLLCEEVIPKFKQ